MKFLVYLLILEHLKVLFSHAPPLPRSTKLAKQGNLKTRRIEFCILYSEYWLNSDLAFWTGGERRVKQRPASSFGSSFSGDSKRFAVDNELVFHSKSQMRSSTWSQSVLRWTKKRGSMWHLSCLVCLLLFSPHLAGNLNFGQIQSLHLWGSFWFGYLFFFWWNFFFSFCF